MKKLSINILLLILCSKGFTQLNNVFFYEDTLSVKPHGFSSKLDILQFLKNNEYFNEINPGQTYFGTQAKTTVAYGIDSHFSFFGGLFVQKNYGDERFFSNVQPIFKLNYHKKYWNCNIGNILAHVQHQLTEPMLNFENTFSNPLEYGVQSIYETKRIRWEVFVNWQQNINSTRTRQEKIIGGKSLQWNMLGDKSPIQLYLPVGILFYHIGGQNLIQGGDLITRINTQVGIGISNKLKSIKLETYYYNSIDNSNSIKQPFKNGHASLTQLLLNVKKVHQFSFAYWQSWEFISSLGNTMFNNAKLDNPYKSSNLRQLYMLRYQLNKSIVANKLFINIRIEPYWDRTDKKFEYAYGLHFRWIEKLF